MSKFLSLVCLLALAATASSQQAATESTQNFLGLQLRPHLQPQQITSNQTANVTANATANTTTNATTNDTVNTAATAANSSSLPEVKLPNKIERHEIGSNFEYEWSAGELEWNPHHENQEVSHLVDTGISEEHLLTAEDEAAINQQIIAALNKLDGNN